MIGKTIKIKGEAYKTLKMDLTIEEAGLITDGSTITMWVSEDENKIPIRSESKLVIGSLKADLDAIMQGQQAVERELYELEKQKLTLTEEIDFLFQGETEDIAYPGMSILYIENRILIAFLFRQFDIGKTISDDKGILQIISL